ncbi:MAG: hypothetical protein R3B82_30410 [Sandaracinaceae bacterium]
MTEPGDVSDEELERVVARVRSIRRRELRAKAVAVGAALVIGGGLFLASFLVFPPRDNDRSVTQIRLGLASVGLVIAVLLYMKLTPREHPDDVE